MCFCMQIIVGERTPRPTYQYEFSKMGEAKASHPKDFIPLLSHHFAI